MSQSFAFEVQEVGDADSPGRTLAAAAMEYAYDKERNREKYQKLIELAGARGADLLVFPEQSLQGYVWEDDLSWELKSEVLEYHYQNSETVPGPTTDWLCELAGRHEMLLVIGMTERHPRYGKGKGGLYNSAVLLSKDGVLAVHRKVHICGSEKHIYTGGREVGVADTEVGRVGLAICYDILFPESARVAAVLGSDILTFITAWPRELDARLLGHVRELEGAERHYFYDALLAVRAWENQMWLVAGSAAGRDDRGRLPFEWQGQAKVIGPDGVTSVETPPFVEGLAVAHGCEIDAAITKARTADVWGDSFMFDRKPHAYGPLADVDVMYPPPIGVTQGE